jgi:hypothetical protein
MSTFQDLRRLYSAWDQDEGNYLCESAQFARRFANEFHEHIGAPEYYIDSDRQTRKTYVELRQVILNSTGEQEYVLPERGILTRDNDGYFSFAVCLVLDHERNAFPKTRFGYKVRFLLIGSECNLDVSGKSFTFDIGDMDQYVHVYNHMIDVLKSSLSRKPWEAVERKLVGFIHGETGL